MKTFVKALCALLLVLGAVASAPALAHGRAHFGFFFGGPLWYPGPYYSPYYYGPPPVYYYPPPVVSAPTVYIERNEQLVPPPQSAPQSSTQPENAWYYCRDSQTYYPYVRECASPWQRVAPRPPGS